MDQIAELLRATAADPPPTGITVDRLIRRERRRTRVRQVSIAAGAGVAVLGVVLATVPALSDGGSRNALGSGANPSDLAEPYPSVTPFPSGEPSDGVDTSPPPMPTEPVAAAIPRLNDALREALASRLPTGMTYLVASDLSMYGGAPPIVGPTGFIGGDGSYAVQYRLSDAAGSGLLFVFLAAAPPDLPKYCAGSPPPGPGCEAVIRPDGTTVQHLEESIRGEAGTLSRSLTVIRPDGTLLGLLVSNYYFHTWPDHTPSPDEAAIVHSRPEPPLTFAQMLDIALAPGMTLFP